MNFNLNNILHTLQPAATSKTSPPARSSPLTNLGYFTGQAIVEQSIQPDKPGRVRFKGSRWTARCDQPITIAPHELVDVIGVQNLTLLVEPAFLLSASHIGLNKVHQALGQEKRLPENRSERMPEPSQPPNAQSPDGSAQPVPSAAAIAPETWQRFIEGKPVYLKTFQAYCEALHLNWREVVGYGDLEADLDSADEAEAQELKAQSEDDLSFVGRDEAIADLNRLVADQARMILILGEGGIGKTVLAQQFFSQAGFDLVLECWMAKETPNITTAESVVLGWLQQHFNEAAGRTFGMTLEQLRRHLQEPSRSDQSPRKIGILIDNLEPALDRQGQILAAHRGYAALLETLSDPSLSCVTVITSREPLHEPAIAAQPYSLAGIDEPAWRQFLGSRGLVDDSSALSEMHQAYSGNPKAMTILSSAISVDYGGDIQSFWQNHQTNLLDEPDLQALVSSHFTRLQQIYP
ncbi:MAG TPA: NfeD family protein, partial [Coleofasciculaceae cyanobacterium]